MAVKGKTKNAARKPLKTDTIEAFGISLPVIVTGKVPGNWRTRVVDVAALLSYKDASTVAYQVKKLSIEPEILPGEHGRVATITLKQLSKLLNANFYGSRAEIAANAFTALKGELPAVFKG